MIYRVRVRCHANLRFPARCREARDWQAERAPLSQETPAWATATLPGHRPGQHPDA